MKPSSRSSAPTRQPVRQPVRRAIALLGLGVLCWSAGSSHAQRAAGTAGGFSYQSRQIITPGGSSLRLEGDVRFYSSDPKSLPFLDISADLVTGDSLRPRRVRAQGNVSFKYRGVRPASAPGEEPVEINIEARAREALLDTIPQNGRRTLTLTGNLSGFYKIGDDRTSLSGQRAVISFGQKADDVQVTIEGGGQNFRIQLPEQSFGPDVSLGVLSLEAGRATLNQKDNKARLEGGVRVDSQGPGLLRVAGAAFDADFENQKVENRTVRRLSRLSSQGRVSLSFALPPANVGTPVAGTKDASYPLTASSAILRLVAQPTPAPEAAPATPPSTSGAPTAPAPQASGTSAARAGSRLVPVSVEISADSAVIEPSKKILTLRGNVKGNYILREVITPSQPRRASTETAPANPGNPGASDDDKQKLALELEIEGAPVSIELPSFNLEL